MESVIPVVDFQKLSSVKEERKKLRDACEKFGIFRIINHPIPLTLMADMKLVAKSLHDLPKEIKMCNQSSISEGGHVPLGSRGPTYEALGIYDMYASSNAVQDFCSQLHVSTHNRQIIEAYGKGIHDLASSISQKMAETLGIYDVDFKDWPFILRIIKYNFSTEDVGNMGLKVHSDTGFITLLQDDETVSGLEIMDDSNSFKAVPPKAGSFLCIVGDVGHVWSNGKFLNVKHRVESKTKIPRFSFGAFMLSSRDGIVEAPAKLVELDNGRLYRPFKYEDLREFRYTTDRRAGEVLDPYRIG